MSEDNKEPLNDVDAAEKIETSPTPEEHPKRKSAKVAVIATAVIVSATASGMFAYASTEADRAANEYVENFVADISEKEGSDVSIEYGEVDASITSNTVSVNDIVIYKKGGDKSQGVNIDSVNLFANKFISGKTLPTNVKVSLDNIVLNNEEILTKLEADTGIDYRDRTIDGHAGYLISGNTIHAESNLSVSDLNSIGLKVTLKDDLGAWNLFQEAYAASEAGDEVSVEHKKKFVDAASKAYLTSVKATYANHGEIEHFLSRIVKDSGKTEEELKASLTKAIDSSLGQSQSAGELKKFLSNPEKLTVIVQPETPVKIEEIPMMAMAFMMGRHEGILNLLNAKVIAN